MKKFNRVNKLTKAVEEYIGLSGVLKTIEGKARPNKVSGKLYYRFTAVVQAPSGETLIGGQLYEELIPYLGATPVVGDKLEFNCRLSDLQQEQTNTRWGIGGQSVDSVDNLLNDIANM